MSIEIHLKKTIEGDTCYLREVSESELYLEMIPENSYIVVLALQSSVVSVSLTLCCVSQTDSFDALKESVICESFLPSGRQYILFKQWA